jgi:peptidyl-prolyl cis-trans isomerase D
MLELLRKQAKSPVLQAIVIIIILVFIFWGTNMGGNNTRDAVATVNGEAVTLSAYSREYSRMIDSLSEQFGGPLPKNLIAGLGIKEQVLQRLVQQTLLVQGAQQMGLMVSNWEIQNEIITQPFFQVAGVFNNDRYKQLLAQNKMTPKQYEESLRLELLAAKVNSRLGEFAVLTDEELDQRFAFNNNEIKLAYATLRAADFAAEVQVDTEALQAYFDGHKEAYKSAPQVKIKYLAFSVAQAMADLTITDEQILDAYQKNSSTYERPETRKARHILLKTDGNNDEAQLAKAEELIVKLRAGGDFSALARQFSDDPGSASQGGDLGSFSRGQMVPAFDEAVFSLAQNEVSAPIKTRFGYHIIEVLEIQPAKSTPLAEVKDTIRRTLQQEQARGKAFEDAGAAYEKIFQAGSLDSYSAQEGIALRTSTFFNRTAPPAELAGKPRLLEQAFSLVKGDLSSLIEEADGYYIIFIDDVVEPVIPALEAVQKEVVADFRAAKSRELAEAKAQEILAACATGKDFQQAVSAAGSQEVQTTPWFSRSSRDRSGLPDAISSAAFGLSEAQPYPEAIGVDGTTFYVYRFEGKQASRTATAQAKEAFRATLLQEKQMATLESWLNHMMKTGEITTNTKLIE